MEGEVSMQEVYRECFGIYLCEREGEKAGMSKQKMGCHVASTKVSSNNRGSCPAWCLHAQCLQGCRLHLSGDLVRPHGQLWAAPGEIRAGSWQHPAAGCKDLLI